MAPPALTRLFGDEHLAAIYRPGATPYTLATFSCLGFPSDRKAFWGESLCAQADIDTVAFVAHRNNWFPSRSMGQAIAAARHRLTRPVVTFGYSHGGYGALKYASALGASGAIAGVPQFSIDPSVLPIAPFFAAFFDPALHAGMQIGAGDQAGRVLILYDPHHRRDTKHVDRILGLGHVDTTLVPMPHLGHEQMDVLRDSAVVLDLVGVCLGERRLAPVLARMHRLRKQSLHYGNALAQKLVRRGRPLRAIAVLETVLARTTARRRALDLARHHAILAEARLAAGLPGTDLTETILPTALERENLGESL
jgi:hypothetical protein